MLSPELKNAIEVAFGRPILYATDCNELSDMIFLKTQCRISSQTLKRVFGFLLDGTLFSKNTQVILEKFGVFEHDIHDLQNTQKLIMELLTMSQPLENDFGYQVAIGKVAEFLYRSSELSDTLFPQLLSNKSARIFLVERNPWIDGISKGFVSPLKSYLSLENRNFESKVFALSLLHFGAFLSENEFLEKEYFSQLMFLSSLPKNIHPFPRARWYRACLFHHFLHRDYQEFGLIRKKMIQISLEELTEVNSHFPFFTYITLEGFCLMKDFSGLEELLELFEKKKKTFSFKGIEQGYLTSLNILLCIVSKGLGYKMRQSRLEQIHLSQLHFTHFQFYQTLFFWHFPTQTDIDYFMNLIERTGFTWFKNQVS